MKLSSLFLFNIYLFYLFIFYIFLAASGLSYGMWGSFIAAQALRCGAGSSLWHGLLSSCGTQAPGHVGSVVAAVGLSCPMVCWILVPRPGLEPVSPEMEGGFFTTGPPGKSLSSLLVPCFSFVIIFL